MSRLLVLQNRLKARARADRLTGHQQAAYGAIAEAWRYPGRLNLCGPPGAGKTFLGWALAYEHEAVYIAAPELFTDAGFPHYGVPIIIDNVDVTPYALRQLLAGLDLAHIRTALLISQTQNPNLLPALYLPVPEPGDIDTVLQTLAEVDYYTINSPSNTNLWKVIHSTL